ncbi:MAG TPA: tyrosine-type recombinase/integrase [Planctomycetota bacterium]|jgi:integrase
MNVKIPLLKLRGKKFFTWFRHPSAPTKPFCMSTGLSDDQVEAAVAMSKALQEFQRNRKWHSADQYLLARRVHAEAAEIWFRAYRHELRMVPVVQLTIDPKTQQQQFSNAIDAVELAKMQQRCSQLEAEREVLLSERVTATTNRPFEEIAGEYLEWGRAQGGRGGRAWGEDHATHREIHLRFWGTKFALLADINLGEVDHEIAALRKGKGGKGHRSNKTVANYREALAAFCDWCVARQYLTKDPLALAGALDVTPEESRRALHDDEIQKLLVGCLPKRRIIYETAICTGLRANELRSLVVADLDRQAGGLYLHAGWTKSRKRDFQPLPQWLVDKLALLTNGQPGNAPLLRAMPKHTFDAWELDAIKRAGLMKRTNEGVCCFHCLRNTFVSLTDQTGASSATTQALARHATPQMTFGRYARVKGSAMRETVEQVGRVVQPVDQSERKLTGSGG